MKFFAKSSCSFLKSKRKTLILSLKYLIASSKMISECFQKIRLLNKIDINLFTRISEINLRSAIKKVPKIPLLWVMKVIRNQTLIILIKMNRINIQHR